MFLTPSHIVVRFEAIVNWITTICRLSPIISGDGEMSSGNVGALYWEQ